MLCTTTSLTLGQTVVSLVFTSHGAFAIRPKFNSFLAIELRRVRRFYIEPLRISNCHGVNPEAVADRWPGIPLALNFIASGECMRLSTVAI